MNLIKNILLATNEELKDELKKLVNEFEDEKTVIARAYAKMTALQRQYQEIEQVLNKREGGING